MADEAIDQAELNAARQAFLSEPPPVLDPDEPEAPAADAVEDDIDGALAAATPAAPEGEGSTPTPPPAPAAAGTPDPFAPYGGEEAVRVAHQVQEAMRTEQGVRALVANGLTALGYSVDQVRAALESYAPEQAPSPEGEYEDPLAGLEDDDVLTVGQVKNLVEQIAQQAAESAAQATAQQLGPVADAVQVQQQTQVRANTDAAIVEVLGPVPTDAAEREAYAKQVDAIVERGARYYDPSQWADPNHIRQAVTRANAELAAEADARYQAYLEGKKRARDSQPVNTGGGAAGDSPLPEPKNLAEARKQAAAAGFFD